MNKNISSLVLVFGVLAFNYSFADRYHTAFLTAWDFELNNGVAYITSSQMPSHCTHLRLK